MPPADLRKLAATAVGPRGRAGSQNPARAPHARLIDQGRVTARVLVPEQSLAAGTLTLRYVPGRISAVQSEGAAGWWRTALPTGPGGELNQRDLDQALENIRRLGSQADASIDVAPGPELGDSDIVIKPGTGKRWHAYIGGDNAGMESTGKEQINAGLTLDSPLFLYDQFSVSWKQRRLRARRRRHARRVRQLQHSLRLLDAVRRRQPPRYRQTVAGFDEPIIYAGTPNRWTSACPWCRIAAAPTRAP